LRSIYFRVARPNGSDGGAEHWAVIASLVETCKLIGVEPHNYLADVISRIVNGQLNRRSMISCPGPIPQAASAQHGLLHVVPECGHYVPLEQPEYLNSILREVIDAQR
jgi:hypothetical protein